MSSIPEFFKSTETGTRVILTQPALVPHVSGDLSLYTPEVGKLRPLMDPRVISFSDSGHYWHLSYRDPATNTRLEVKRTAEYSMTLDSLELKLLVPSPETLLDDSSYMATCQFVLFHGCVDELDQLLTVVTGLNEQGMTAMLGNRSIAALDRKRYATGSLQYLFPGIGALYLPSSRAVLEDPERVPQLDDRMITPLPIDQATLSRLGSPPLPWV